MKRAWPSVSVFVLTVLPLLLVSCGGGGGGSAPPDDDPPDYTGSPATSEQIQAARDELDGAVSLPVAAALVTYVTASYGAGDPAGFFIQAEQNGPALFVAVDPATLSPGPAAGDVVDLTITEMSTTANMRWATAIAGFSRTGRGYSAASLAQDVRLATDLVSSLDVYESELITTAATISTDFSLAGSPFVAAVITTEGIGGNTNLRLRMPGALQSALYASDGLLPGCTVTLTGTPLWRYVAVAQPSAWKEADITVDSCPAPRLQNAVATDATTVRLAFSRPIAASSITDPAAQFLFTGGGGLTAAAAQVNGATVDVTTSAQSPGAGYTLDVAATVTDVRGTGVETGWRSAQFLGFNPVAANLVINEVDYDTIGTDTMEFIEIYNPTAAAVNLSGYLLSLVNGSNGAEYLSLDLSSAGTIAAYGYLVVSSATVSVPAGVPVIHFAYAANNVQNGSPDGIALVHSTTGTLVDALSYEGSVTAAVVTGITGTVTLVEGTVTAAADDNISDGSLVRCPNGNDTDDANVDWQFKPGPNPGAANTCL